MRFQGKISEWNDDKGYGFVEPNGGGERTFIHIKSFKSRARRPANGDLVIYEVEKDSRQRSNAVNVSFPHE
ncbi:cold-shock protein [Aeromonas sp. QDB11]